MRQVVRWMNFLSIDVMAKRAKKSVVSSEWTKPNDELLNSPHMWTDIEDISVPVDNSTLSSMVESIEKIKEKDPLSSWLMESSIKYMDRPLKVLKAAAPKHIIKEVKCCFDCVLHGEQVAELLPMLNELVFAVEQNIDDVEALLKCERKRVRVKNNRHLAYFLHTLEKEKLICFDWNQVAEDNKVFESKKGTVITASNLSSSLNRFGFLIDKDKDSERVIEIKKKIEDAVKSAKG